MSKRSITSFFAPVPSKKSRTTLSLDSDLPPSAHASYPFPIARFPADLVLSSVAPASTKDDAQATNEDGVTTESKHPPPPEKKSEDNTLVAPPSSLPTPTSSPERSPKAIKNGPDLDILHFNPFLYSALAQQLYLFLRRQLSFHRVEYAIRRGDTQTLVKTPRYTALFGVDQTSFFREDGELCDTVSKMPVPPDRYVTCTPRPVPECLKVLMEYTQKRTDSSFNIVLVNYYASTSDSISYHSDDESFLGPLPTIASLSLGSTRDFCLKHKSLPSEKLTLPLSSGEMVLMRGTTQQNWLHSIPKRAAVKVGAGGGDGGRINVTFRKALTRGGTENYYRYNVGTGPVFRWDEKEGKMVEVKQ